MIQKWIFFKISVNGFLKQLYYIFIYNILFTIIVLLQYCIFIRLMNKEIKNCITDESYSLLH